MSSPLDTAPLTDPVDRAEVRAFTADLRRRGVLRTRTLPFLLLGIGAVVFVFAFGSVFISLVSTLVDGGAGSALLLIPVLGVAALLAWGLFRSFRTAGVRRYRLDRFARANGMTWHPGFADPSLPGMIFDLGHDRETHDLLRRRSPRFVEVGNYSYQTGSGKNETTHKWGYVALRLDTPLPHIVLDAVGNNGLFGASNLPVSFGRGQRLSLEGDFDRHFALYCPEGYERDALYLFTPDVMARFVDNAAALDVEIVDDWLFLYAKRDLSTLDPATWQWLFTTLSALDDKLAQWARWRDERLASSASAVTAPRPGAAGGGAASGVPLLTPPPAGVARPGRRLRRGFSWITGVFVVLGVGWWLLTVLADVFVR
ncbi:hypothetical protein [uncultured Microbacterium sp.]|uniref:hypothetical protein n=1 Tax=uncultured Microbacterium sp. TaxID=191216 RepID=UPI0025E2C0B8|nr:hypothetical protein [uncultured Microbacterium sp.]